jgi:hypothetical protein
VQVDLLFREEKEKKRTKDVNKTETAELSVYFGGFLCGGWEDLRISAEIIEDLVGEIRL